MGGFVGYVHDSKFLEAKGNRNKGPLGCSESMDQLWKSCGIEISYWSLMTK